MDRSPLVLLGMVGCAAGPPDGPSPASLTLDLVEMSTLSGSVTWTVSVDADAELAGYTDCTYTRTYVGTEDRSRPWLCPQCEVHAVAQVEMSDADLDCWEQISNAEVVSTEWIGLGAEAWWRSSTENAPLNVQAVVTEVDDGTRSVAGEGGPWQLDSGTYSLSWSGQLDVGTSVGDPHLGLRPPTDSDCGWPRVDTPEYAGPQRLALGEQVPDGAFRDVCAQGVSLHDFAGHYLVIDLSAPDCVPCHVQAATERQWLELMASRGLRVEVVTLLTGGLSAPFVEPPVELLVDWTLVFGVVAPVLADRGWGYAMATTLDPSGVAYPTSLVLSPNGTLLGSVQGFQGWDPITQLIVDDRRGR